MIAYRIGQALGIAIVVAFGVVVFVLTYAAVLMTLEALS